MLFIILLCFGFGVASVIALFGFFPQATEYASSLETTQVTANKNEAVQTDEDYQAFRETVLAKDEELVENYRNKKRQRRENATHKNNGQKHYEDRIAQIESEMQSELIRKTPMKKGSLSWGLQNDLNKIKSDPPPGFAN